MVRLSVFVQFDVIHLFKLTQTILLLDLLNSISYIKNNDILKSNYGVENLCFFTDFLRIEY